MKGKHLYCFGTAGQSHLLSELMSCQLFEQIGLSPLAWLRRCCTLADLKRWYSKLRSSIPVERLCSGTLEIGKGLYSGTSCSSCQSRFGKSNSSTSAWLDSNRVGHQGISRKYFY